MEHEEQCNEMRKRLLRAGATGPWIDECDQKAWIYRGYACLIWRNSSTFSWLGYVQVPEGHKFHGADTEQINIDAHGGVTFSGYNPAEVGDNGWWIGFDCAHAWDLMPFMEMMSKEGKWPRSITCDAVYRDEAYVMNECERMVDQLIGDRFPEAA